MDIVNTPVFQRLRRIRQLAMADLVYPGALHTRFEHSLGATHLAHRILSRLFELRSDNPDEVYNISDEDWIGVRLAALLHDIGHGPFSHVSENLLDRSNAVAVREKIHEQLTVDIITREPRIAGLLTDPQRELVTHLIQGFGRRDFRRDIISGNLDVDKMDYLLRDAYFAGVRYGHYDLEKVIDAFRIQQDKHESHAAIADDGIFAVEQLIMSKYHMNQQVYSHKVRAITDQMIVRGLELALETSEDIRSIYEYDGSPAHLHRYLEADDNTVSALILHGADDRARDIFQRLRERRLYKQLTDIRIDRDTVTGSITRRRLLGLGDDDFREIEQAIALQIGVPHWQVIIHKRSVRNPAYHGPAPDPEEILVVPRTGEPQYLGEFSELVEADSPEAQRLMVIGPDVGNEASDQDRRKSRQEVDEMIRSLISTRIGGNL